MKVAPHAGRGEDPVQGLWQDEGIIREELFSIERLEQHAASLALAQQVTDSPRRGLALDARLRDNEARLNDAYRILTATGRAGSSVAPAAAWFTDNFHLVEVQIQQIHDDLPPRFYHQLPKLRSGPFAGYPRVFGIAWASIAHSDSHFDPEHLRRFVTAYQRVQPLTIGELWAVAITLRIALIENLRRAVDRIVSGRAALDAADAVADRLLGVGRAASEPDVLAGQAAQGAPHSPAFVVQLVKRLRDQDPEQTPALQWLDELLATLATSADELVYDEHQRQGAANVTVRNIVTSLRLTADMNWPDFFESVSLVDEMLRTHSEFAAMDFATRNLYRSAIEDLARGSKRSELAVTQHALDAVAGVGGGARRERDPGHHLIGRGRRRFERSLGYRPALRDRPARWAATLGPVPYLVAVSLTSVLVLALPLLWLAGDGAGMLWLFGLLGLVPATDTAVALVNRAVTRGIGASLLPGLALTDGVPPDMRTMVVIPTLLTTPAALEALIGRLEVHFLASAPGDVHYALLTDWTDAVAAHAVDDDVLLDLAAAGIARLNAAHAPGAAGPRFLLLHRRRRWSEGQACWMGWERKRGKLHELNRLLRGATDTSFMAIRGEPPRVPPAVRYVVTLDTDTRLPREAVRRLVGKMAHPLNEPAYDESGRRVIDGYAVLQPRVTPSLPVGREGSLFQRVFSSMTGINAYDTAAADVYQDLFGTGSYAGKGIYDVDAFETTLADRVPEGSLLSHDLFEGTFARSGLVSDIEVVEEFPSGYGAAAARNHRWARGDWQLLPWIFGRADTSRLGREALPLLALWKMLDNLRRTLSAPACVVALVCGWSLPAEHALIWTSFIVGSIALPTLLPALSVVLPQRPHITLQSHLRALGDELSLAVLQIVLSLSFLAHQALLMLDAIARTLYRLFVSHRNLLEWVTAAQTGTARRAGPWRTLLQLGGGVLFSLAVVLVLALGATPAWGIAAPFLLLWSASPLLSRWISRTPPVAGRLPLADRDRRALRLVARRTWRYFDTFVTADEHWLPPDNFQEDPAPVVAHRTSPTNLGLYLLSIVSARDFGWLGTAEAVDRIDATLTTMQGMARHRGHFFNWYDTRDLRALAPRYVSSVDSGNLAAHLITLANACAEWRRAEPNAPRARAGIDDALRLALAVPLEQDLVPAAARAAMGTALDGLVRAWRKQDGARHSLAARLAEMTPHVSRAIEAVGALPESTPTAELAYWIAAASRTVASWQRDLELAGDARAVLARRLVTLEAAARGMALAMDFGFLLDAQRNLLSIGYLADEGTLDASCYDLLASEARLASFFAIAKHDVPTRHWFRLGRQVTAVGRGAALISWSGSMFEYLMPSLVMRAPAGSLLERTSRLVVRRQMAYTTGLHVPWGISESAYGARDLELTYQYSNFGVPGLGLKRGLGHDLVIAPYATALAAMVDPRAAGANFARLAQLGALGRYGYCEAIDFTRARLPAGAPFALVGAYMAHHQGMTIVALANVLFDGCMRARFHAEPIVQATELLLQERTPRDLSVARPRTEELGPSLQTPGGDLDEGRRIQRTDTDTPQTHLLSNGRYAVMVTSAGAGYSRWRDLAITRWQEDATRDAAGSFIYLRDVGSGAVWSASYQPCGVEPASYDVTFTEDRAVFVRRDDTLTTTLQIVVSTEDDAEVRRVSIANAGRTVREIEVTACCELVLAAAAADDAHPAFSKLFVQTDYLPAEGALIASRRQRDPADAEVWVAQQVIVEGDVTRALEYETDRARLIGRGRDAQAPAAIHAAQPLSNTVGTVLDPVFALRSRVRIAPGTTAHLAYWTVVATTQAAVRDLLDKHHDAHGYDRAATLAWTQARAQLLHLGISDAEADLFQRLAGHVIYAGPALRPSSAAIRRDSGPRDALWAQGISGDRPLVLLRIGHAEDIGVVRQLLQAHEYWRLKQLAVDLVILNERAPSYVQDLQHALETALRTSQSRGHAVRGGPHGEVFVLRADQISAVTRGVLSAAARVVLVAERGGLAVQLERLAAAARTVPMAVPTAPPLPVAPPPEQCASVSAAREFDNGSGGFVDDGREYQIQLTGNSPTPAPWINVIANARFGCQVSAEGAGYTWSENSRENQLSAWSNDPVCDPPGEAFYVRDERSGACWSPTLSPLRDDAGRYTVHHGRGYSRFEHVAADLTVSLLVLVSLEDPIKICRLTLQDRSGRARRMSATAYVEWVLGGARSATAPHVMTRIDAVTGALFATNPMNRVFPARVAFADLGGDQTEWTGDRREFIGRHGRLAAPAGLAPGVALSQHTGAGLDPCAALRSHFELAAGGRHELVFLLGEADDEQAAQSLVQHHRAADPATALAAVVAHWDATLGTLQVRTPDRALDLMLNGWLLYQTLTCRVWARAAFYQASGAYGFRDQLQDSMALVTARPDLTRAHLLRAAARQFPRGDVQHWWVPATGEGVRTGISDDRLWLAYVTEHYVRWTGDRAVLDAAVPFVDAPPLAQGEHDAFSVPAVTADTASLFEHCARALDDSLALGVHGLPLIGTGDWNDGLNRVGPAGRGESVWLGWFLYATLTAFAPLARERDPARATRWLAHAAALRTALEREAWDGDWYRRGYFDDGTPFGTAAADECRIDAIAQSWSVLSGAASPARAAQAMAAVERELVRPDARLALLFAPPFALTPLDPGYIKAYPPGLRENGGQYTHAAAWSVFALAALGEGDRAAALFDLVNPVNLAATAAGMQRYRVEPYVVAADVYSVAPHVGRGGWTWYTGAAGWLYRAGAEAMLGFRREGESLLIAPCIPAHWPGFELVFVDRGARYEIRVENPDGVNRGVVALTVDGVAAPAGICRIPLGMEAGTHVVTVTLGQVPGTGDGADG